MSSPFESARRDLESIDTQIEELLILRDKASREVIRCKSAEGLPVYDGAREAAIVRARSPIWRALTRVSRAEFISPRRDPETFALPLLERPDVLPLVGGPCSYDTFANLDAVASELSRNGCAYLRAGAWKPRTSPGSWQGLGREALGPIVETATHYGLRSVVEAVSYDTAIFALEAGVDVIQVGARNGQNFELLKDLNRLKCPVLLKRSPSATVEEWLSAADYLDECAVTLCERGVVTNDPSLRNRLDLAGALFAALQSGRQVIVDVSHSTGNSLLAELLPSAVFALQPYLSGVMAEVHAKPDEALTDKAQALDRGAVFRIRATFESQR